MPPRLAREPTWRRLASRVQRSPESLRELATFLSLPTRRRDGLTLSVALSRTLSVTLQLGSPHGFSGSFAGEAADASSVAMSVELEGY